MIFQHRSHSDNEPGNGEDELSIEKLFYFAFIATVRPSTPCGSVVVLDEIWHQSVGQVYCITYEDI